MAVPRSAEAVLPLSRLGSYGLVAVGMWLTSRAPDARARIRMLLDGFLGAGAGFLLLWSLALEPA